MRVIGGEFRSRVLKSAPGLDTRPTPDRLREALFNVLAPRIEDTVFMDAYAGTGAVGIEALSRGARAAVFIERAKPAIAVLRENLRTLNLGSRARVVQGKVSQWLDKFPADIVFLDPPYELEQEYEASLEVLGAAAGPPLVIVQHAVRYEPATEYGKLRAHRTLRQGD
ncbi:MAG: 16S rRNA (guanine(966)-N(2))-methyltransferase RsmD, partial [Acidobacteria bacterium]|nr:16S rRNA (guanine(966)-N(2))-methyltransferase RsmD [Acidobacteriota bacterium]